MFVPLPPHRTVGARIAARRAALGLTQGDLADRLGLASPETISRYERGEREPRVSTLSRIAEALGVHVNTLVADDDDPPPAAPPEPAPPSSAAAPADPAVDGMRAVAHALVDRIAEEYPALLRALVVGLEVALAAGRRP
jgi:transcriptional regulator with XRE-family HTH domain